MTSQTDYEEFVETFFRDILRAVDTAGAPNGYVTVVHHPDDYDLTVDPIVLKASGEWVDRREYIIRGITLPKSTRTLSINVNYVDCDDIIASNQGQTCFDVLGALFQVTVDMTKYVDKNWRHTLSKKIAGQVRETLQKNITEIYTNVSFTSISIRPVDLSTDDRMLFGVQVTCDLKINP